MKIETVLEIYDLVSNGISEIPLRKRAFSVRKKALNNAISKSLIKNAFDTRRIDQESDFNPRRGLQNYNRSEQFVSEALGQKIKSFAKLKDVLTDLKDQYGKEHEWQDSNARVLLSTLNKGLRTGIDDGDFSDSQPSMASIDYIEELLQVRYRLGFEDLNKLGSSELKKIILAKDEELIHKDVHDALHISKNDVATQTYDTLLDKLFGGVKASKDHPEVERTITITIKDKFVE
jgi:hypothetical protein